MANWFCDTVLTTGLNDGTSMDNAWQSMKTAFEYASYAAGDVCWFRRRSSYTSPTSAISLVDSGTRIAPIRAIGWPRNSKAGSATFTNGSRVVSAIATITPNYNEHAARMLKNDADGKNYMITALIHKVDYTSETGTFTEGLMVTSAGAGAGIGKIHRLVDNGTTGTLYIVVQSGTFAASDAITDEDTGAATVSGTPADDGFLILNKYAGTTNTGNCTIEADEDYAEAQAIVDTTWTIKKTDYNGDNDAPPELDFGATAYYLYVNGAFYWHIKAFRFKDGTSYAVYIREVRNILLKYCLLSQAQDTDSLYIVYEGNFYKLEQCIIKGNSTGTSQRGIYVGFMVNINLKNVSIYNMGDMGIHSARCIESEEMPYAENCNVGVALPNDDDDVYLRSGNMITRDLALGAKNGGINISANSTYRCVKAENYNQVLGSHRVFYGVSCYMDGLDVVAGSGDPQKRTGGADKVIDFIQQYVVTLGAHKSWPIVLANIKIWADTSSKSYQVYVQAKDCLTSTWDVLFLEVEYIDGYDATDEYHKKIVRSDETISLRSGTTDWSQYVEVTGIQPAVAGWVRIKICVGPFYDADGHLFIDPKVVIS